MPSPFPGMNPYLERRAVWHDFHESFLPAAREAISSQIAPNFIAKIDEHVFIHELSESTPRQFFGRADLGVADLLSSGTALAVAAVPFAAISTISTEVSLVEFDEERLSFLEIRDRESWKLVTVIELLSPANKQPGPDREQYIAKRELILRTDAHLVEIDLLRGGPRLPLQKTPECDYCVLLSRWEKRPRAEFWPIRLRETLPVIPIPLTAAYPDATLDLQAVLNRVYDAAGYQHYIYREAPEPVLPSSELEWAESNDVFLTGPAVEVFSGEWPDVG